MLIMMVIVGSSNVKKRLNASVFFLAIKITNHYKQLFCSQDLEMNDGSEEKPYYMSADMMRILSLKNKAKEE